jgi:phosphoribosylformylglycinamidine synthase
MRIELGCIKANLDGRGARTGKKTAALLGTGVDGAAVLDVYILDRVGGFTAGLGREIFHDPVAQNIYIDAPGTAEVLPDWTFAVEVTYKAGVTNPEALTAREAVELALGRSLGPDEVLQTARQYVFAIPKGFSEVAEKTAASLYNPLIESAAIIRREDWAAGVRFPRVYPGRVPESPTEILTFPLADLGDEALAALSRERLLSLSAEELRAVRSYYRDPAVLETRAAKGLPREATDVEIEMIAQTWSEHCKHKIFAARIRYREKDWEPGREEIINSLFSTYIKGVTEALRPGREDLKSVFHDNSGVVLFDEETLVCIKAETHNSPSALDPYGGAITGIVGVNRDIMGTGIGARPIFNTNVLCFGDPAAAPEDIPKGLLHPRNVLAGVHHGIVDGGNQSGIPVAAGAFLFDDSYTGKPLVFCGTAGILPARVNGRNGWEKRIEPGDLAVMAGGRVGKDGIHGATFSSAALDDASPTSAVQIGDPITQKKLLDFLLEARDLDLYKGITDNGAGGLSSSLGEMAQYSGGVLIRLEKCPVKYSGLAPWEILLSESQERMSLAVAPDRIDAFLALARRRGVEAAAIGEFTDSGSVDIFYFDKPVGALSLEFLHDGLPTMDLRAEWAAPDRTGIEVEENRDLKADLLGLLSEPNIGSKEPLIRQYDHEVQAGSVIKPFSGVAADGPTDGGVFRPRYDSYRGLTITHGIRPRLGDVDTYDMAVAAVDEAYRAHIALGGDPDLASALDNFCWPDPVESPETPDGAYKLAQLVRTCRGLKDACLAYNLPLISGKDSMKNDARIGGKKVSVRPTLLVTVMGIIRDIRTATTPDFKRAGDLVYLLGGSDDGLGGGYYEKMLRRPLGPGPKADLPAAARLYRGLHRALSRKLLSACHDISDGGLAVALAECCLGGRLGARIDIGGAKASSARVLFSEAPSRFVAAVPAGHAADFEAEMEGLPFRRLGEVVPEPSLEIFRQGVPVLRAGLDEIEGAYKRFAEEL